MHALPLSRQGREAPAFLQLTARLSFLVLPATLMLLASLRTTGMPRTLLWMGAVFQVALYGLHVICRPMERPSAVASIVMLYLLALVWIWASTGGDPDWYMHLTQAILLVVPLMFFALQVLSNSGAFVSRRATLVSERLQRRGIWPDHLDGYRELPEVIELREALQRDPAPALALLEQDCLQVRIAALIALEGYTRWRPVYRDMLVKLLHQSDCSQLRAAILLALKHIDHRASIEALSDFLRDSSREVRRAAKSAVFEDCERRWKWIRHAVRTYLSMRNLVSDGPLVAEDQAHLLTNEAINDLRGWAAEKGTAAERSVLTLAVWYGWRLRQGTDEAFLRHLRQQLASPETPAMLRLELAALLRHHGQLDRRLNERLLDSVNPALLRLQAVDALLAEDARHHFALNALKEIARQPNREIALTTAAIAQRHLQVDLGLPLGEPLPPVTSPLAAEVTRHVISWANQAAPTVEARS